MTDQPGPEAFARGRWDVAYWAEVYLGIKFHPGQVAMSKAYLKRNKSGWRAAYHWIMVAAGNRAGKTLGLAVIILHSCSYKMGTEPPSPDDVQAAQKWYKLPYDWWHFAIEQAPAELVYKEVVMMLTGNHPAQPNGCPWADQVGAPSEIAQFEQKERGEYAWIRLNPKLGGAQIHFRSTKAKALGSLGQNMHGLSHDEAGLQENPTLKYLMEEVFHARRLGTGGQFILISTPSAATSTEFEDLWYTGEPGGLFTKPRRFSLQMSSRQNVGYGLDEESFADLIEGQDEDWVKQNIDGEFIQASDVWFHARSIDAAFDDSLPEMQEPGERMVYAHALDPGLKDKTWSMVFKINRDGTADGVWLDRMVGKQSTRGIVNLGIRSHKMYENADKNFVDTGVDTTALGGHMFRELLEEAIPVKSVEFGGLSRVKRKMLSDARSALDEGRIRMPTSGYWMEVRRQLRNYKLADRKIEQDLVMCFAIIVKLMRQAPGQWDTTPTELDMTNPKSEREEDYDGITSMSVRDKFLKDNLRSVALTDDD